MRMYANALLIARARDGSSLPFQGRAGGAGVGMGSEASRSHMLLRSTRPFMSAHAATPASMRNLKSIGFAAIRQYH